MINAPFPRLPDVPTVLAALVAKEFNLPTAMDRRWEKTSVTVTDLVTNLPFAHHTIFCKLCPRADVKLVQLTKLFLTTRSWIWLGACEPCKVIYWDLTPREEPA